MVWKWQFVLLLTLLFRNSECLLDEYNSDLQNILKHQFGHLKDEDSPRAAIPMANINASAIDSFVNGVMKCRYIPGVSLAIVQLDQNDNVIASYSKGYGTRDPSDPSKGTVNADTRFCIGSCTKQFTAALLGKMLMDKQYKSLFDTPVSQLLGSVQSAFYNLSTINSQLFTLRDVLGHRTAFPRYDWPGFMGMNGKRDAILQNLHYLTALQPLSATFRSSFHYNNWMYTLAGYLAEQVAGTGDTWETLVQKHFFQPLNMTSSTFLQYNHGWQNFAIPGYLVYNNTLYWKPALLDFYSVIQTMSPAGSICSTANDMLKYLHFLLQSVDTDPTLPTRSVYAQTMGTSNSLYDVTGQITQPRFPVSFGLTGYGMGFFQGTYRAYRQVQHGGSIFGYLTHLILYPDLKLGLYVSSTNSVWKGLDMTEYIQDGIFDILFSKSNWMNVNTACTVYPEAFAPNVKPINVTGYTEDCQLQPNDPTLLTGSGNYSHPFFGTATITRVNGQMLRFNYGKYGNGYLCNSNYNPTATTYRFLFDTDGPFFVFDEPAVSIAINATITFQFDKSGSATSFTWWMIDTTAPAKALEFTKQLGPSTLCNPNPCQHQGTCAPTGPTSYSCVCQTGFQGTNCQIAPRRDCTDLLRYYHITTDGVQSIYPPNSGGKATQVFCDMTTDGGGWTLFQRRVDGSVLFTRGLSEYENGFGSMTGNHWLGLDKLSAMFGPSVSYSLRVDLWNCNQQRAFETYSNFWIANRTDLYRLHFNESSGRGSAGDGLSGRFSFWELNGMHFSTPTLDHDPSPSTPTLDNDPSPSTNCALIYACGWWFNNCFEANLNGIYVNGCGYSPNGGVVWLPWSYHSLYRTEMKIRNTGPYY